MREYSTKTEAAAVEPPPNVPEYWVGHPEPLTRNGGMNRFVWDLRYAPPPVLRHEYPISALYQDTPGLPLGAMVTPGKYSIRLTVNGRTFEQPLEVAMDPRVDVSADALAEQLTLERKILDLVASSYDDYRKAVALRQTLARRSEANRKRMPAAIPASPRSRSSIERPSACKAIRRRLRRRWRRTWRQAGARIRRAQPLHRRIGVDRRRPGRRADARHADRLRGLLPRNGHRRAELE